MRSVYAGSLRIARADLYAWWRPEVRWMVYRLQAVSAAMLCKAGLKDLSACHALDVGCGSGAWSRTLIEWGVQPKNAHGVDMLPDRIELARAISGQGSDFRVTEGALPYDAGSFDIITAHTVFSSILAPDLRMKLAADMMRVCRQPQNDRAGGIIMVYDFRIKDPRNPDTIAIGKNHIRHLFEGCEIRFQSLTLAPPLLRRLARFSMPFAALLEWCCPFLRTHLLALIQPSLHQTQQAGRNS